MTNLKQKFSQLLFTQQPSQKHLKQIAIENQSRDTKTMKISIKMYPFHFSYGYCIRNVKFGFNSILFYEFSFYLNIMQRD